MFTRLNKLYHQFPPRYWIIILTFFIDSIGATLLFPFFSLYITDKFSVGMTQAGMVLAMFSIFGVIGNVIGGALTDRFGRRKLILFGLIFSGFSTLSLGFVNSLAILFPLAAFIGLLSDISGPAHQAMLADILDEKQRQEGFGLMRVVRNLAWIIGPSIGGFLANRSFMLLFIIDAIVSCIVAFIFYKLMPETKPQPHPEAENKPHESLWQTLAGYGIVLKDFAFMAFIIAANFAPVEMRGRYMAIFGMTWLLPSTFAPMLAGIVLDNLNPNLLWYIGGALCAIAAFAFYALHLRLGNQHRFIPVTE